MAFGARWDWTELRESAVGAAAVVLASRDDAEDAAQEAMIRAWRSRERCIEQARPAGWVAQIARNEALRLGSRLSRRLGVECADTDEVAELGSPCSGLADLTADTSFAARVAGLPISDRELLELRYVEDLEYTAIAKRLGLPLGTVKVRLHRLRARLREANTK